MLDVVTALGFDVVWESLLHFMELSCDGDGGIQDATQETAKTCTAHKETAHAMANVVVIDWSMSRYQLHGGGDRAPPRTMARRRRRRSATIIICRPPLSASSGEPLQFPTKIK